jgi:hypothetical protein
MMFSSTFCVSHIKQHVYLCVKKNLRLVLAAQCQKEKNGCVKEWRTARKIWSRRHEEQRRIKKYLLF